MRPMRFHVLPLALPVLFVLFLLVLFLVVSIEIGVLQYAYEKMGVDHRHVLLLLFLSLGGSIVNIPVARLRDERVCTGEAVTRFGMRYVIPRIETLPGTLIALNLGGAIIPTLLSCYLVYENGIYLQAIVGVTLVSLAVHRVAYPVRGMGIAVPTLLPPLLAASAALILSTTSTPALAYVCGSLGTLIGADISNLGRIRGLGAPVASIGGAGTFDGIFLSGVLAVLLA